MWQVYNTHHHHLPSSPSPLEGFSPEKSLLYFGQNEVLFWAYCQISSVSNENTYIVFAFMESYWSHGYFGTLFHRRLTNITSYIVIEFLLYIKLQFFLIFFTQYQETEITRYPGIYDPMALFWSCRFTLFW